MQQYNLLSITNFQAHQLLMKKVNWWEYYLKWIVWKTVIQNSYYSETGGCVRDFMSTELTTVGPEMGIVDLAQFFQEKHFRRLPVVENGKLIGQVSRRDILKAI